MEKLQRLPKNPNERQAIDIALSVSLAEYDQFRNEIIQRLRLQKMLERFSFIIVAVLISAISIILKSDAVTILLLGSLLLFGIATSFFSEDINITIAASYIERKLKPRIYALTTDYPSLPNPLFDWETFRHEKFLPTAVATVMTANRTIMCFLPGAIVLMAFFYLKLKEKNFELDEVVWTSIESVLITLNAFALVFLTYLSRQVPKMYQSITTG